MSFQILHILSHGSSLHKERGQLVLRNAGDSTEKRCALEDLRALIVAARGVSFSGDVLSVLCRNGTVVLHCDDKYCPCGVTAPLTHTVRNEVLLRQCKLDSSLHRRLWEKIVTDKVDNQSRVLNLLGVPEFIPRSAGADVPDESVAARFYWPRYFAAIGCPNGKRDRNLGDPANQMLNYGYAVLMAMVHRAVAGHGLLPEIGFHHLPSFAGFPLVYDLMEPFRPFMDFILAGFMEEHGDKADFAAWCKTVSRALLQVCVSTPRGVLRLIYALDVFVEGIAGCLEENSQRAYWSPILEKQSFQNGLDHDDVRSAGDDGGRA